MKTEYEGIHPDEGSIHAWLDDALDADEASRVALHVESCAECAGLVAEARGLIAGASRVVRLLDDPSLRENCIQRGLKNAARFTTARTVDAYLAAYATALDLPVRNP